MWNRKLTTALKLMMGVAMISMGSPSVAGDSVYARYFPGDAQNIVIPDLKKNLDALLQYDHTACGDLVRKEVDLINQYGVNAALSQRSDAKKVSHQIHELLNAAKTAPNQPCLDIAFKTYAVGSIFLLDPKNYNSPKVTIGSGVVTNDFAAMKGATEVSALSNFPLTYLTAALANKGKLQFFLEPVDLPGDKGEQVNANSNSPDSNAAREVLGAYDCSSSTLHLDPWLPPLDLGATLLHELDHLFLDKKFTKDELNAEFANADGSINWRAYVLDDEFAAITHSAIAQRAMYVVPRGFWHFTLPGSPYSFQWSTMPYQLDADLRLFSKEGPIASLELMFEPGVSTTSLLSAAAARNLQLTSRFLNEQFAPFASDDVLAQFDKASAKIVEIVNEPYFQGSPLTPAEKDTLRADRHGMELIPLPIWIRDHDVSATPLIGAAEPKEGDLVFVGPTNSFSSDKKQISRTDIAGMGNLIKGIDEIVSSMDQPSEVCKLYMDAVGQGLLGDYIGTEVQLDDSEAASAQPGAAGARPGAAGARPGAAGARPGAAGARPGAAGARPSAGNIRPCLSQMHDL